MTACDSTYLSIVAVSRNDGHGGDMLGRMQVFVDTIVQQFGQLPMNTELILVEWNPPADRPALSEALRWPHASGNCAIKIISVPPAVHRRYRHADKLALFQMIGKNVGIRRAQGEFIVATNVDILFSQELVDYLTQKTLEENKIYRVDRADVPSDVSAIAKYDERMRYCRENVIRVAGRHETLRNADQAFQYMISSLQREFVHLREELRAGLGRRMSDRQLLVDHTQKILADVGREGLYLLSHLGDEEAAKNEKAADLEMECESRLRMSSGLLRYLFWDSLRGLYRYYIQGSAELFARKSRKLIQMVRNARATRKGIPVLMPDASILEGVLKLHFNACGDFTLMSKKLWNAISGYPELEMYSMNIDSLGLVRAALSGAEEIALRFPFHIFHMDHSMGWTPESDKDLYDRMKSRGIPILTGGDFNEILRSMAEMGIVENTNWGLAEVTLPETLISVPSKADHW